MAFSSKAVVCKSSEEGTVLLDIEHDRILKLNGVGKEIWRLLCHGYKSREIVITLSQKYQVAEERLSRDVEAFMALLQKFDVAPKSDPLPERPTQVLHARHPWYGQARQPEQELTCGFYSFFAFIGLLAFDVILTFSSFKTLCACVKSWPV